MQAACNCAKWARPFDSNAPSMEAQAHTSCNRRASCYVRATAPPLTPLPCLLDCGTSTVTRGNPAYDPTVPARHIDHGSVSRGRRRDGRYGQKWADSNGGGRRAEAAVTLSAKLMSHLARPRARTQPRKTTNSASPDPGLGLGLGPGLSRRSPPRPTQGLGLDLGLGRQTRPRPRRSLHLAQPRARTDHVTGGAIITPPQANSGYREQDRRPIWLAPVK
jgi:hypothetical protein